MSDDTTLTCPECGSEYTYELGGLTVCSMCAHEWSPRAAAEAAEIRDAVGNVLADGDSVVLIKDLKVKGAGQTLKQGTVIRSIRLTDDPDEIDCRHDTIKGLVLRTEFVRKR